MHKKYASQGLVTIALALDDPTDKLAEENVLKFLKKQKSPFSNVLLDDKAEVWQEKFGIFGVPCFFIFNRDGRYRKLLADGIDDELRNIEKVVVEFLEAK